MGRFRNHPRVFGWCLTLARSVPVAILGASAVTPKRRIEVHAGRVREAITRVCVGRATAGRLVVAPGAGLPSSAMESTTSAAAYGEVLRGRARKALADFRAASRFFKLRLGIVSAWALLSLVTLWATCPSSGPANALGADVQVSGDSLLGGQILVRNESGRIWEDVVLTLDDGWRYTQATMRPHDLVVVSVEQFRRGDEAPPRDYRPRGLRIECAQGAGRFDLR